MLSHLARRMPRSPWGISPFARWYSNPPPTFSTQDEQGIYEKLTEEFKPSELHVEDVSGGCGSFYSIAITSEKFRGLNLLSRQRLVNQTLKEEIKGIHGLQLKTLVPK